MPPILPHVDISRLQTLQSRLEELSDTTVSFIVLLAGSTLIATLGLFQNSPAVIIGAMIIAPLMRPLAALSLATLTADTKLLSNAIRTLLIGTCAAISLAFMTAQLFHSFELTDEILARTHPTLLDLGVAIAAGAVASYCQAKENLTDSLAGVAIAVALVPPLSVVGIGLSFGNPAVWLGALLLYATNLVGISAAGSIVFLVMGFTPLRQAKNGLVISALLSIILIVPLAFSMRELVLENLISSKVKSILKEKTFTFRTLQLQDVQVQGFRSPMSVVATVVAPDQPITSNQVAMVQSFLAKEIGRQMEFKLRIIPAKEIGAVDFKPLQIRTFIEPTSSEPTPSEPTSSENIQSAKPVQAGTALITPEPGTAGDTIHVFPATQAASEVNSMPSSDSGSNQNQ